jgi:hypothetical protein
VRLLRSSLIGRVKTGRCLHISPCGLSSFGLKLDGDRRRKVEYEFGHMCLSLLDNGLEYDSFEHSHSGSTPAVWSVLSDDVFMLNEEIGLKIDYLMEKTRERNYQCELVQHVQLEPLH